MLIEIIKIFAQVLHKLIRTFYEYNKLVTRGTFVTTNTTIDYYYSILDYYYSLYRYTFVNGSEVAYTVTSAVLVVHTVLPHSAASHSVQYST